MAGIRSWLGARMETRGTAAFLIASLVLGILVGLGAALLVWAIAAVRRGSVEVEDFLEIGSYVLLILIPVGILLSWLLDRRWGPGVSSGGVTETMVGLTLHAGYLSTKLIPTKILATATTLGTGGSGGREGPIALIGATIGSSLGRYTRFGEDQIRSLVAAGAGAGIGASFNAPIAGMLFAMEVVLGSWAIRHLSAVVVASVAAAVTTRSLVGEERILSAPAYALDDPRQLILYAVLALIAVLFGVLLIRVLDVTAASRLPNGLPAWTRPVAAGLIVATIGLVDARVLGTGQAWVATLTSLQPGADLVWWGLLFLAVFKIITNAVTRAGGGSAGSFMPALFIGANVGVAFALLVDPIWNLSLIEPGAFAVVGMAAAFAASARAPLTSVIMVFEITGNYGLVLPLMLGAALATFVGDRFSSDSAYTISLTRRGIHLPTNEDIDLLDTVDVADVMSPVDAVVSPSMSLQEVDATLQAGRHHGISVVDDGKLVGIITLTDIADHGGPVDFVSAQEAMTDRPITVTPRMPVSAALARMASLGVGRMPVVDDEDPRKLVGMFRRESVVRAYHHALGTATGRHLYRERVKQRTAPGARFFEVPIPRGSPVAGKSVQEIRWPEGATIVSVRRGPSVLIPHGDTVLRTGDALTAFGTGDSRVELAFLLEPVGDDTQEWTPD